MYDFGLHKGGRVSICVYVYVFVSPCMRVHVGVRVLHT